MGVLVSSLRVSPASLLKRTPAGVADGDWGASLHPAYRETDCYQRKSHGLLASFRSTTVSTVEIPAVAVGTHVARLTLAVIQGIRRSADCARGFAPAAARLARSDALRVRRRRARRCAFVQSIAPMVLILSRVRVASSTASARASASAFQRLPVPTSSISAANPAPSISGNQSAAHTAMRCGSICAR